MSDNRSEKGVDEEKVAADEAKVAEVTLPDFDDPNIDKEGAAQGILEDDSPYPEVRSAVANTDDPDIPVSTIRSWFLGICCAIPIPVVALLITFPVGRAWARVIPNWTIFGVHLNPGPFSIKEHVLITIMATVGYQSAYATDVVAVQRVYYNQVFNFGSLSYFSWVCWIAPNNIPVNQMFGYIHGLGMSLITFVWAQIAYIGSPLATPCEYLPISSRTSFDNTGNTYNVSRIINADTTFNQEAYSACSPLFLSTTFAISYGLSFASITATLTHAFLFFRKQIWTQARRAMHEQPDIHACLMSRYHQVPQWWHIVIFREFALSTWETKYPVEYFILALAITNQQVGLNVVAELIIGYALPGHPVAMMLSKTWGYITMVQALQFTSDFKLGHYMKVPHRAMFLAQVLATVIAGTVQLGVQSWMFTYIPNICSADQKDGFICPCTQVFGTASIIWGVIGPARQFSKALTFFFLIGAICPAIAYLLTRKFPNSIMRYVNFPVIFSGTGYIPPASAVNYVPWTIVGFIFQYVMRRRHFSWVYVNTADASGTPMKAIPDGDFIGPVLDTFTDSQHLLPLTKHQNYEDYQIETLTSRLDGVTQQIDVLMTLLELTYPEGTGRLYSRALDALLLLPAKVCWGRKS
ncbi:hypothetical protein C0995_003900 [Termitomyces sp. Mi166|nr:hypothetical protein C0995_003900 [Termitomyces sp. Mi166\